MSYRRELAEQFREQSQAVEANSFVFRHHHDAVEKLIDNLTKARNGLQRLLILPRALVGLHLCGGSANSGIKFAFGAALEQLRVDVPPVAGSDVSSLQDLANALEGYRQGFEVLGLANSLQRHQAFLGVHQVIGAGAKDGADLVVAEPFPFAQDKL